MVGWSRWFAIVMVVAVGATATVRSVVAAPNHDCTDAERDERGNCPEKRAAPPSKPASPPTPSRPASSPAKPAPAPAAETPRLQYTRPPTTKLTVTLSDAAAPIPASTGSASLKPELDADQVRSIEGLDGDIRTQQEPILIQLIANTSDSEIDEKSDYYFRLGQLYTKQERFWRLKAAELQTTPAQANEAAVKAKDYLVKATKAYKALTDNEAFRTYPKMDTALFYYGYTLQGGKYMKEARGAFDRLLKDYPNSKYVPEVHLAFADYFFEANDLTTAEGRYKQVLKFPKSSVYWYAMYKLGWVQLDLQRAPEALETFVQVAQATKDDTKQEILNRASKKDLLRVYAEAGKADKAFATFQHVDPQRASDMLQTLADLYFEQGKSDKAIYAYQELMTRATTNKDVCRWQYNVARATLSIAASKHDKGKEIELCPEDLAAFKEWARVSGVAP